MQDNFNRFQEVPNCETQWCSLTSLCSLQTGGYKRAPEIIYGNSHIESTDTKGRRKKKRSQNRSQERIRLVKRNVDLSMSFTFCNRTFQIFFRRNCRRVLEHKCKGSEKSSISHECTKCRFEKCQSVGMSIAGRSNLLISLPNAIYFISFNHF